MADPKPLWLQMADICLGPSGPHTLAAFGPTMAQMLRAIADEVAPETMEPVYTLPWVGSPNWARWDQRMETRAKLLKAAAEAEGEV